MLIIRRRLRFALLALAVQILLLAAGVYYYVTPHSPYRTFLSGGVPLAYTDEGAGEPVILVHGFAVHGDLQWRRAGVLQALRPHFRVITLDLRGHGRSGKPHQAESYGVQMVDDVVRLMDELRLPRAHVVGYSLGGFITLKLATRHPGRLLSASVLGAGWERPQQSQFLQRMEAMAEALARGDSIDPPSDAVDSGRATAGPVHRFFVRFSTRYLNDGLALAGVLRGISALSVSAEDLGRLTVPLLNVVGERDPLAIGAQNLQRAVPAAQVVFIPGATHLTAASHRQLRETLLHFLQVQRGRLATPL